MSRTGGSHVPRAYTLKLVIGVSLEFMLLVKTVACGTRVQECIECISAR